MIRHPHPPHPHPSLSSIEPTELDLPEVIEAYRNMKCTFPAERHKSAAKLIDEAGMEISENSRGRARRDRNRSLDQGMEQEQKEGRERNEDREKKEGTRGRQDDKGTDKHSERSC